MADTESRNSIFLALIPILLLGGSVTATIVAHGWRAGPSPQDRAAGPTIVVAPAATRVNKQTEAGFAPTRQSFAMQTPGCGAAESLRENRPIHVDIFMCQSRRPVRLTYGNLRISAMWRDPGPHARSMETFVTVRQAGHRPQTLAIDPAIYYGLEFNIGTLDRAGHRYLMVQSYTGGPHCCVGVDVMIPEGPDRGIAHLGAVDAAMTQKLDPSPTDVDGDGLTDFIIRDNRFLYEFAGYAGTAPPPPRVWNIHRGRAVEVSAEQRYRPLFEQDLAGRLSNCLQPVGEIDADCPEYIAIEARLGRFRSAWRTMMRIYDPARHDSTVTEHFPNHLRRFLRATGYLRG